MLSLGCEEVLDRSKPFGLVARGGFFHLEMREACGLFPAKLERMSATHNQRNLVNSLYIILRSGLILS
jgi:hypothetical protein